MTPTVTGAHPPASPEVVSRSGRTFVALRRAGRGFRPTGTIYHAVTPNCRMALCAAEPGAGSSWAEPPAERVTCRIRLRRLARLGD